MKERTVILNLMFALGALSIVVPFVSIGPPLKGVVQPVPSDSTATFLNGRIQDITEVRLKRELQQLPNLVRTYNQIQFSLFNQTQSSVIQGERNVLFEENYLENYSGVYEPSTTQLQTTVQTLKVLNDTLSSLGKGLLFVIAPSKTTFYSEAVPEEYQEASLNTTDIWERALNEGGIPCLDLRPVLEELQDSSGYSIFPHYGIHWTEVALHVALRSVLSEMSSQLNGKSLSYEISRVEEASTYAESELDLWRLLNLWNTKPSIQNKIGRVHGSVQSSEDVKLTFIADSFYWSWFGRGYMSLDRFESSTFLYYNSTAHIAGERSSIPVNSEVFKTQVYESDIVVIMLTEANLRLLPLDIDKYLADD